MSSRDPFPFPRLENDSSFTGAKQQQAPNDSLDFSLKSIYDHSKDFLLGKRQTLYQRESVSEDHGRILKNHENVSENELEKDIIMWVSSQRSSIYSIQGTIESHHNASANRGYSRKDDGGFYST
ncbi:protein CFAP276-like [Diretmus argenteus]